MHKYISIGYLAENINTGMNILEVMQTIMDAPAADVVEVVYCKDCKHHNPESQICSGRGWPTQATPDDGFCDAGRRK